MNTNGTVQKVFIKGGVHLMEVSHCMKFIYVHSTWLVYTNDKYTFYINICYSQCQIKSIFFFIYCTYFFIYHVTKKKNIVLIWTIKYLFNFKQKSSQKSIYIYDNIWYAANRDFILLSKCTIGSVLFIFMN